VEFLVRGFPGLQHLVRRFLEACVEVAEPVVRGEYAVFPGFVAGGDGLAQRLAFDEHARLGQLREVVAGDLGDPETAVIQPDDEGVGSEPGQGLADRAHARAVATLQGLQAQGRAGCELAADDVVPHLQVDGRRQRGAAVAALGVRLPRRRHRPLSPDCSHVHPAPRCIVDTKTFRNLESVARIFENFPQEDKLKKNSSAAGDGPRGAQRGQHGSRFRQPIAGFPAEQGNQAPDAEADAREA